MKNLDGHATLKSIWRHHPFFNGGYTPFGYDFPTFHVLYPEDANTYRRISRELKEEEADA